MTYQPEPLDTSSVVLDDSLLDLTERLARHTHDVWAQERLRLGWSWGPRRDDTRREHPGLVPYEALPDAEREFDRRTAMETVKALIALGYRIAAPPRT